MITREDGHYLDNSSGPEVETMDVEDICESADAIIFDFANVEGTSNESKETRSARRTSHAW